MVDVQSVFKKYKIDPSRSINRLIQDVSVSISESSDPLVYSNHIINHLGCKPFLNAHDASIIAKCLIQTAVQKGKEYDPAEALADAEKKLANLRENHPYLFVMKESSTMEATATTSAAKRGGDKKAKALAIFEANRDKKASDVAKLIQMDLGITFANAYYYVSRVFK
jgi:hypothetical protein